MTDRNELLAVFKEEAGELIDQFGVLAQSLGEGGIGGGASDDDEEARFEELLRATHNLKGAARTLGFSGMETLCHHIEEDLQPYRSDPSSLPENMRKQLIKATSALQILLEDENDADVEQEADDEALLLKDNESRTTSVSSIRVDTNRFDELMGFSGDLLMSKARMEERNHRLKRWAENLTQLSDRLNLKDGALLELREIFKADTRDLMDFSHLTDKITDVMKRVRMVPLRMAERGWREIVRKVAHSAGKEVEIVIETGDIELDKQVLDKLRDPMMHLLRNAIDHGIESVEERTSREKTSIGRITVNASLQGTMVQLKVADDGRGVDREKIQARVLEKGLIEREQIALLSDEDLLDHLFSPGFSTASEVSSLSGRGVGLDVVRAQIEGLGGRVSVWSPPNNTGTTFILSVPLSVLSTMGLNVRCGETSYALPLEYVQRTVKAQSTEIKEIDGYPVLKEAMQDPIRLIRLSDLLGTPTTTATALDKVVVLSRSNMLLGLLVDQVEEQCEFVAHSMPWNLKRTDGVSGASLRPDGTVAVVLDVPYLFEKAGVLTGKTGRQFVRSKESSRSRRVLVADDSLAARTMEKAILLDAGYDVTLAQDGEAAWRQLSEDTFDLLVSDVNMPELDGLELTRRVRTDERLRDLPIILVTSLSQPEDRIAGANAGADEYIVKGTFDQNVLLEVVSKYV